MITLIDNYDSFTFNLVQAFRGLGAAVAVVRNDEVEVEELLASGPRVLVLSPGPGCPKDAGICPELVARRPKLPMLGVCLGHQVMADAEGAEIVEAEFPRHGKTSRVEHDGEGIFSGLSQPFEGMRYHSLVVNPVTLPHSWKPVATAEDGVLMGMRHRELPWWGVQFHPESVLCPEGPRLLSNFLAQSGVVE